MSKKITNINLPLHSNLPTLDLHGEDRITAEILVKQFIDDNVKLKNPKLIIIHGIGTGILKKQVHSLLKKDKRVDKYYINFFNVGCTIVEIEEKYLT